MKTLVSILFILLQFPVFCAEILFSGEIGQSRPEKPLDFIGVTGLVSANGKYYFCHLPHLYSFSPQGEMTQELYVGGSCRQLLGDGIHLWFKDRDGSLLQLESSGNKKRLKKIFTQKEAARPVSVIPQKQENSGWGKQLKFAVLEKNSVSGYDANGNFKGTLLNLPEKEIYNSIAFLPESGDLLVSTAYPKCMVFRFKPDGKKFQWEYKQHLYSMFTAGNRLFGADSRLLEIPENFKPGTVKPRTDGDDMFISGVVQAPDGGYYLGTSQGIIHYPENRMEDPTRIGGFPGCYSLAVNEDGIVLALSNSNQNLVYAMRIDDSPDSPFLSSANPTSVALWNSSRFRKGTLLSVSASGRDFYILNQNGTQTELWKFSPYHFRTKYPVRQKWNLPESKKKKIVSTEDDIYLISEADIKRLEKGVFRTVASGVSGDLAAAFGDGVILYRDSQLFCIKKGDDGRYHEVWKKPYGNVLGIAAYGNRFVLLLKGKLVLCSVAEGTSLCEFKIDHQSGGAVAMNGHWIFAANPNKKSITRYQIKD